MFNPFILSLLCLPYINNETRNTLAKKNYQFYFADKQLLIPTHYSICYTICFSISQDFKSLDLDQMIMG